MEKLIDYIVKNKVKCYFVSPHQDDAIYSAGGLISHLSGKAEVVIINVFDGIGKPPYTLSAKKFLKICGFKSIEVLSKQRCREEQSIADNLKIKIINLGYDDALWRKKDNVSSIERIIGKILPEILHIYPLYRYFIKDGNIRKADTSNINNLSVSLKEIINGTNYLVFCPSGIGGHIDHKITKMVCEKNFEKVILWSDFPYNRQIENWISSLKLYKYTILRNNFNQKQRCNLSKLYYSQKHTISNDKRKVFTPEEYFIKAGMLNITAKDNEVDKTKFIIKDKIDLNLKNDWNVLWQDAENANLYNSYEWFEVCRKTTPNVNMKIVCGYVNNKLILVLPLAQNKVFNWIYYSNPAERHTDKFPLLLKDYYRNAVEKLLIFLRENLHNIYIHEIDAGLLIKISKEKLTKYILTSESPYISKNDELLSFVSQKLQKTINKLLDQENENIRYVRYKNNLKKGLDLVFKIEADSTRSHEGKKTFGSYTDRLFYKNMFVIFRDQLCLIFLVYKGKACAYRIGLGVKNVYYTVNTAYKKEVERFVPGKLLLYHVLKYRLDESLTSVDMLRGFTQIKRDFTPFLEKQFNAYLFENKFLENFLYYRDRLINYIMAKPKIYRVYQTIKVKINLN